MKLLLLSCGALAFSLIGCALTTKEPDSIIGIILMVSGQMSGTIILVYIALFL